MYGLISCVCVPWSFFFSCNWYLVSALLSEKMLVIISTFLNLLRFDLLRPPTCGLSWRMFHVHLRRNYILLHLDGKSWTYQLGPFELMFHLRFVFPYYFCVLMVCPFVQVGCPLLFWVTVTSPLSLLVFVLCIEVLLCWVHKYLQLLCLLGFISWSLCSVLLYLL